MSCSGFKCLNGSEVFSGASFIKHYSNFLLSFSKQAEFLSFDNSNLFEVNSRCNSKTQITLQREKNIFFLCCFNAKQIQCNVFSRYFTYSAEAVGHVVMAVVQDSHQGESLQNLCCEHLLEGNYFKDITSMRFLIELSISIMPMKGFKKIFH